MDTLIFTYLVYSLAAIVLTGVLAKTLYRNGKVFLAEVFDDNPDLARAVNSLLVTGFYMLNLGYAFLLFRAEEVNTTVEVTENLVAKLGLLLLSLGVIHFVNMAVFWKIRRSVGTAREVPATFTSMVPPPPRNTEYAAPAPY